MSLKYCIHNQGGHFFQVFISLTFSCLTIFFHLITLIVWQNTEIKHAMSTFLKIVAKQFKFPWFFPDFNNNPDFFIIPPDFSLNSLLSKWVATLIINGIWSFNPPVFSFGWMIGRHRVYTAAEPAEQWAEQPAAHCSPTVGTAAPWWWSTVNTEQNVCTRNKSSLKFRICL